jgi:deoxyribodipyrimidine photo-lyase
MRKRLDLAPLGQDPRVTITGSGAAVTTGECVLYWMQNAQRAEDNAALDQAILLANSLGVAVSTFFALDEQVPHASARTFSFMLQGLRETQARLADRGAPLVIRRGPAVAELLSLCVELRPAAVVTDLSPLRRGRALRQKAASVLSVPLVEVDTEHIVPLLLIGREHWAARTLRPVIERHLPAMLVVPPTCEPEIAGPVAPGLELESTDLAGLVRTLSIDHTVGPVPDRPGGRTAGLARLRSFLDAGLVGYRDGRSAIGGGSGLSPYLRFGQLAPLRVALAARAADAPPPDRAAFLEQLIVRRELAANFVFFNGDYGSLAGAPAWARATLARHADDPRPALYGRDQLESAATADDAWNAAQRELLHLGRIEGYPRMYWGKKLIEWTADPADALALGLELNDRYALDGRSPNGFTNLLWCFGCHDRPWPERPIFGTVRTMTSGGLRRKLDHAAYVARTERAINQTGREA